MAFSVGIDDVCMNALFKHEAKRFNDHHNSDSSSTSS